MQIHLAMNVLFGNPVVSGKIFCTRWDKTANCYMLGCSWFLLAFLQVSVVFVIQSQIKPSVPALSQHALEQFTGGAASPFLPLTIPVSVDFHVSILSLLILRLSEMIHQWSLEEVMSDQFSSVFQESDNQIPWRSSGVLIFAEELLHAADS